MKQESDQTKTSISLQDVLDTTPAEDTAETRVMRSIEQDEENGRGSQHTTDSPLTDGPKSVEEELFGLTSEMEGHAKGDKMDSFLKSTSNNTDHHHFVRNAGRLIHLHQRANKGAVTQSFENFKTFLAFRKDSFWLYSRFVVFYSLIPGLGVTCLLYYVFDNPGADVLNSPEDASSSWWVNFLIVRLVLTLSLAKGTEAVLIDYFCLRSRIAKKLFGPFVTLLLVQSEGWPFQLLAWGAFNFLMLYGSRQFCKHWLFYQQALDVFNANNPAGYVLELDSWRKLLIASVVVGGIVALKRFFVGLRYGQGVFRRYGKDLSNVMKRAAIIAKVAELASNKEAMVDAKNLHLDYEILGINKDKDDESHDDVWSSKLLVDTRKRNRYTGGLAESQKAKIDDLLGEWEEPTTDERKVESVSISAIVQFQAAVTCIDNDYPFSPAFGLANKREVCIESSQKLFLSLTKEQSDSKLLKFDTIAVVALQKDGQLNEKKVKDVIEVFRPTRDGELTMLDFAKSIDTVYKDLRMTRASIANANKMNAASQRLVDLIFYFILAFVILAIIGINPIALFGALTAFIVGFAFMIGGASSIYFEGLLLVLVRKPYDIGDRIAVSGVESDVSGSGSSGWVVKDLNLFCTTVIFAMTGEEATYSNGSLARSRIINHNRSPKAVLNFDLRFGIDTPKQKITAFGKAVEDYVKNRPREWLAFCAFRLTNVMPDQGFIEYMIFIQHRESWQQIGALLTSKADVQRFAYELSKEFGMGYENPAMPIILRTSSGNEQDTSDVNAIQRAIG